MSDDKRGWRTLPPVLVMAIVLQVAAAAYYAVWRLAEPGEHWFARAMLTSRGIHFAIDLMAIVGVFELARRSTGRTRAALTGAWIAFAVGSVVSISFDWVFTLWAPGIDSSFDKDVFRVIDLAALSLAGGLSPVDVSAAKASRTARSLASRAIPGTLRARRAAPAAARSGFRRRSAACSG